MDLLAKNSIRILGGVLIVLAVTACGGGASGPLGPSTGSFDAGGSTGGGPGGGGFFGNVDTLALQGGVLATFSVGGEQFRAWFVDGRNADVLVAAFSGAGAPITTICADLVSGSGRGAHNGPWQWSVAPNFPFTEFNSQACNFFCNTPFRSPSEIENSVVAGTFHCKVAPPLETGLSLPARFGAFMQVALIDVRDLR